MKSLNDRLQSLLIERNKNMKTKVYYTIPILNDSRSYLTESGALEECKRLTLENGKKWTIVKHTEIEEEIEVSIDRPAEFNNSKDKILEIFDLLKFNIFGSGKNIWSNDKYKTFYIDDKISETILDKLGISEMEAYTMSLDMTTKPSPFSKEFERVIIEILNNYPPDKVEVIRENNDRSDYSGMRLIFTEPPYKVIPSLAASGYNWDLKIGIVGNRPHIPRLLFYESLNEWYNKARKTAGVNLDNKSEMTYIKRTIKKLKERINTEDFKIY